MSPHFIIGNSIGLLFLLAIYSSKALNDKECGAARAGQLAVRTIVLETGRNIGYHVKNRLTKHLSAVETVQLCVVESIKAEMDAHSASANIHYNQSKCIDTILKELSTSVSQQLPVRNVLFLSVGNSSLSTYFLNNLMSNSHLEKESFLLQSYCLESIVLPDPRELNSTFISCNAFILVSDGLPLDVDAKNISFNPNDIHYGAVVESLKYLQSFRADYNHYCNRWVLMQPWRGWVSVSCILCSHMFHHMYENTFL